MRNVQHKALSESCPKNIMEILPLVVNGTVDLHDHPEIREGLEAYPSCRQALREFEMLREATVKETERIHVPEDEIFEDVMTTIRERETAHSMAGYLDKIKKGLRKFVPSPAIGLAFAVAMIVIFIQFGIILHQQRISSAYQTLSGAMTIPANRVVLNVIFNPNASERAIRAFLENQKAQIIQGPGPGGVYQVTAPKPHDLESYLKKLRGRKDVIEFVEARD